MASLPRPIRFQRLKVIFHQLIMKKVLLAIVTLAFASSLATPSFATVLTAKNNQECKQAAEFGSTANSPLIWLELHKDASATLPRRPRRKLLAHRLIELEQRTATTAWHG
jgi:hypothetical protein